MKAVVLLMIVALVATAQTPIPHSLGECGFDDTHYGTSKADIFDDPAEFRVSLGNLCKEYTFEAGWEETMELHLGEGAEEYLEWIELAVKIWNDTVSLSDGSPVFEINYDEPRNPDVPFSFWRNTRRGRASSRLMNDRQNVIYMEASDDEDAYRGTTWVRPSGGKMQVADIFINTQWEETYSRNLYRTKLILDYDEDWGAYAYVNATFEVILHELGHAIGLKHIPVTGNVMSYRLMAGIDEQWREALSTAVVNRRLLDTENDPLDEPYTLPFAALKEFMSPNSYSDDLDWRRSEIMLFSESVELGSDEKMLLNCIYEF